MTLFRVIRHMEDIRGTRSVICYFLFCSETEYFFQTNIIGMITRQNIMAREPKCGHCSNCFIGPTRWRQNFVKKVSSTTSQIFPVSVKCTTTERTTVLYHFIQRHAIPTALYNTGWIQHMYCEMLIQTGRISSRWNPCTALQISVHVPLRSFGWISTPVPQD